MQTVKADSEHFSPDRNLSIFTSKECHDWGVGVGKEVGFQITFFITRHGVLQTSISNWAVSRV